MPPDPPRGYRLRRAFIRTPLRQILDPPQSNGLNNEIMLLISTKIINSTVSRSNYFDMSAIYGPNNVWKS